MNGVHDMGGMHGFGPIVREEVVEIRVWDSNSDMRYMVLPERPSGPEPLSEADLVSLVTRDAMIGVAKVQVPATPGRG